MIGQSRIDGRDSDGQAAARPRVGKGKTVDHLVKQKKTVTESRYKVTIAGLTISKGIAINGCRAKSGLPNHGG